jgi:hypothetical protein
MREIRRRTRVGAFPDGQSALMLCAACLRRIAGTKWGTKRYLSMDALHKQDLEIQLTACDGARSKVRKVFDTTAPSTAARGVFTGYLTRERKSGKTGK